jgi:hypothetical protein
MVAYSLRIKKGKYQLDLTTTDKEVVSEQFELWVQKASEYARKKKTKECKNIVNSQIRAEEEITRKNIETQLAKTKKATETKFEEPVIQEKKKKIEETPQEDIKSDLDIFYAPPKHETINQKETQKSTGGVFDNILENSLHNPQTELSFKTSPTIKKDNAYLSFITSRKIEKKIDYLLLTAYYFTQYEQKPRFTLKQLNAKLMQNIAVILDHSVLQEAINRDYIECLPDLTGVIGASEYRLTAYGEKVLLEE